MHYKKQRLCDLFGFLSVSRFRNSSYTNMMKSVEFACAAHSFLRLCILPPSLLSPLPPDGPAPAPWPGREPRHRATFTETAPSLLGSGDQEKETEGKGPPTVLGWGAPGYCGGGGGGDRWWVTKAHVSHDFPARSVCGSETCCREKNLGGELPFLGPLRLHGRGL